MIFCCVDSVFLEHYFLYAFNIPVCVFENQLSVTAAAAAVESHTKYHGLSAETKAHHSKCQKSCKIY